MTRVTSTPSFKMQVMVEATSSSSSFRSRSSSTTVLTTFDLDLLDGVGKTPVPYSSRRIVSILSSSFEDWRSDVADLEPEASKSRSVVEKHFLGKMIAK